MELNQPEVRPVEDDWVTSPEFMRGALVTLAVGAVVAFGIIRWVAPEQPMRAFGPLGALVLALLAWRVLVVRGVVPAKQVLGVGGLVYTLALCGVVAGVQTPVIIALPVLLMMIGWLFSPRMAMWATGASIAALWVMVWGAHAGWLPADARTTPTMYAVIQTLMLVLTVYMTVYVFDRYADRMEQLRRTGEALTQRTQALETTQARLQLVIDASETVFWEYDIQADALSYEEKSLSVLSMAVGHAPTHVRDWVALVHPDDKDLFVQQFRAAMRETAARFGFDYRMQGPDNTWVWITVRGAVVRLDDSGKPAVLGGAARSIQERKAAEAALQASEEQARHAAAMLRSLCDNVPDMIWAKGLDKRYLFANRAICDQLLMAHSTEEPVGKDDMFFAMRERDSRPYIHDWHTFGELCQDSDGVTLQRGKPSQFEEFGHVKGRMLVLDVHKAPFRNDKGEVIGVVGTGRDITDQKTVQDRLRLASLVLEHSSEALMITDATNTILEINPAFTRQTGYRREDVLGKKPSVLQSGMHDADFYRLMWEALQAEGTWQGEITNRRKNGELFVEWLTINTLYGDDGLPYRRVALFSDVTENKKKEERLWQAANFDLLTLLPNRRMFQDRLDVELKKVKRTGGKLAVLFLDLDRFKEVNDTLGHHMGDLLLREAARRILACVRASDTVARLGGDEFTVILTELDEPASAARVAQAIVASLSQPFDLDGQAAEVSASIGIAIGPHDAAEPAVLVQMADQAMYAAKQAGRNGYRFFNPTPPSASQ